MKYKEFEEAVDTLGLCTKVSLNDLKERYKELSKIYHPDMPTGDAKKFDEVSKAYKLLKAYMQDFRFSLSEDEFYEQFPAVLSMDDWLSGKTQ
ncbi:J domain-containing protein [Sulfurospirillum sp. 1307]|jgi:preprotein translocase subunit Sec63